MWSRVLLLWLVLGIGALALGSTTLWLGQFVSSNVRDELEGQQITFKTEESLTAEEREIPGLIENAGKPLATGNQAKVYSEMIALHMRQAVERAGYPEASYATLGQTQNELRAAVTAATEAGDEEALAQAEADLAAATGLRNTLLTGNNLKGSLLSAYGWDNVATGVSVGGVAILVLALVFLVLFVYELRQGHLPPTEA
jgi:hypothetical protein